jgi:hypothetical protein
MPSIDYNGNDAGGVSIECNQTFYVRHLKFMLGNDLNEPPKWFERLSD